MTEHILNVFLDVDRMRKLAEIGVTEQDLYDFVVECSDPVACPGWLECPEDHEGFDVEDEESPAYDEYEDVLIHGELHDWNYGWGWVVVNPGCPVQFTDVEEPDEVTLNRPGRYLVDPEWDDTDCYLIFVKEITE